MHKQLTVRVTDPESLKWQMLHWAHRCGICAFYDSHHYPADALHRYDLLIGAGAKAFCSPTVDPLAALDRFVAAHPGEWIFGHLGFGLKDELFKHMPAPAPRPGFSDLGFFVAETVLALHNHQLTIYAATPDDVWQQLQQHSVPPAEPVPQVAFQPVLSREEYLEKIETLLRHIGRGDCYEINYCQAFEADAHLNQPWNVYQTLTRLSPVPFAAYYRRNDQYLLCASPERYLHRQDNMLTSQPIKGTAPRHPGDAAADAAEGQALLASAKNRSENIMVVDLVRNDLSRVCLPGTVTVRELCGLYSFPQVHQLISTIRGEVAAGITVGEIIAATFPMGSMTGAPKQRVLELTEALEPAARGLYSGSVGYIDPSGNFDFNVVIRSVQYNEKMGKLSYHVGGAITAYSTPEAEYEECLLKASALRRLFSGSKGQNMARSVSR